MKSVIFMNSWHVGGSLTLQKLLKAEDIDIRAIIVRPVWSGFSLQKRNLGYLGIIILTIFTLWHFIPMIFFDALGVLLFWKIKKYPLAMAQEKGILLYETHDVHSAETLSIIQTIQPDIIILNHFNQIIRPEIITLPKIGVFNLHPGKIPQYKGNFPTFWALLKGEKYIGVTVHHVDEGIDTGGIVEEKIFRIHKKTTLYEIIEKSSHHLAMLTQKIAKKLKKKQPIANKKRTGGTAFSFPQEQHIQEFLEKNKQWW